ncbi:MAG: hypothetical protein ACRCU5_09760, partial [Rhizobiaceae bacterium]
DFERLKSALTLTHRIAISIIGQVATSAVHWCMSDQLVSPEFMETVGKGPTLTPLCVRPNLFSSSNQLGRGLPVGMVANGSQYLVGRPVVFKEAAVDVQWMMERISNFIDMCHIRDSVIAHGESFGVSTDEVIKVAHTSPTRDYPMGTYELTAVHVPQFRIIDRAASEANARRAELTEGEAKLDPNDPIDRLILARLEERRVNEDRRASEDRRSSSNQSEYPNDRRVSGAFGRRTTPFGRRDQ